MDGKSMEPEQVAPDSVGTMGKREPKPTYKALCEKVKRLQNERSDKFNKAKKLREMMVVFMQNCDVNGVLSVFDEYGKLCEAAKGLHNEVMSVTPMPQEEMDKQNTWFRAKKAKEEDFHLQVKQWLSAKSDVINVHSEDGLSNVVSSNVNDDVQPDDSVSNVESKHSRTSRQSGKSTVSEHIRAEAERAALLVKAASLKERQALEAQEEELRRKRQQLEIDAELAASAAKLAVLDSASESGRRSRNSNGKSLHVEHHSGSQPVSTMLNPVAKPFTPLEQDPVVRPKAKPPPIQSQAEAAAPCFQASQIQPQAEAAAPWFQASQMQPQGGATTPLYQLSHIPPPRDLSAIMQRQNEITAALVQQQLLMSLPSRDIPVFEGDPLQYRSFIRAFEHNIESKANKADCLYFLEQFTKGQPRELVRSCQHMMPDRGYDMAKQLLQEHFGNEFKIASSYIEKALAWPAVKSEDVKALQAYALFLRNCCNVMTELQHMKELDMPTNMRMIMTKLPYKFREKWRTTVHELLERRNRRAVFNDLVTFVERQVKILADPLFGDIQDRSTNKDGLSSRSKSQPQFKYSGAKGNSFATTVTHLESKEPDSGSVRKMLDSTVEKAGYVCVCCLRSHALAECPWLKSKKHQEKIHFLKQKGICFGCLCSGHMSGDCEKRLTCKVCGKNHPTMLHINRPNPSVKQQPNVAESVTSTVTPAVKQTFSTAVTTASTQTCGLTGAGNSDSKLSILPVQVKSSRGDKIMETYAFLDPGSSATFCSDRLMHTLNVTGRQTNFLLRTMGQERVVPSTLLKGLEVSGLNGDTFYNLPEVLTQRKMPVTSDNIVTQEDIVKWPYLSEVQIPSIEANVDLLIGTNAPKLLEPWEVVNSRGNGPYAVRTVLGWVINGPLQAGNGCENGLHVASVNRISVSRLEEMLSNQYNHDFNERISEGKGMSREDVRFLKIMDESIQLLNGHYSVKLPFRKDQVTLPNNLCVIKQRLLGLKRRFRKDDLFHKEYTRFFTDMISNGYAEVVPQQQLDRGTGQVWYVPHHGVYHPRKGNLRVVFDCGAEFQGTSLNNELLQGPNLTSSLLGVLVRFRQEPVAFMGDIKSMFYQVKVPEEYRDFLWFLWWPEGNTDLEVVEHRMTVHLFGAVSSPSCVSYALRKTAEENRDHFAADVVDTVKRNFYVDDCLKSLPTDEEAVIMVHALSEICRKGGFTLTKWTSNSQSVLQSVAEEHRARDSKELNLDRDELPIKRALGLLWCVETDSFKFKMVKKEQPHTRRGVLSIVSSVYDPLGFLSPVTLPTKSLLQELCRRGCNWDDNIPEDLEHKWTAWLNELERITSFKVNRCVKPKDFGRPTHAELHHFSDASERGFGTVTYLRLQNSRNSIHVAFMLGKARVTPLKQMTIPRLELTAAVLAVRVDQMLKAELQLPLDLSTFWTDSMSVIKYIKNEEMEMEIYRHQGQSCR